MDYKKMIEQLRSASLLHGTRLRERMVEAADAIETLLAERDAAVECMHGNCGECVNCEVPVDSMPCRDCYNGAADHWQWSGPQKEGGGYGKT